MTRTERPNGRTYGECCEDELRSIALVDGKFRPTLYIMNKPGQLPRNEALRYYTQKLGQVWKELGYE